MFLANENIPRPSIVLLRTAGLGVRSIQEEFSGITDEAVIQLALKLNLIILTFDSDYGELIFRYAKHDPPSVVYFRDKGNDPEFAAKCLLNIIENMEIQFTGAFTVLEEKSIRQRFYKSI